MTEIFSTKQFVLGKIHQMFVGLGVELVAEFGDDEEMIASIPLQMFKAESYMRSAWANYLEEQDD